MDSSLGDFPDTSLLRNNTTGKSIDIRGTDLGEPSAHKAKTAWMRMKDLSGKLWATIATCLILLLDIILSGVFLLANLEEGPDGLPALHPPTCESSSRWFQGLHYAINIFASILLAASNYFMQRLSSCTRSEVDTAHRK
jgi:hypothetical protein